MNETVAPKIGLALSGGGARAIAFHLGCLRALHRLGLLDRVVVLSTVSGGSVIGAYFHALVSSQGGDFASFEANIRALLAQDSPDRCAASCSARSASRSLPPSRWLASSRLVSL